jgi:hypothetical protein
VISISSVFTNDIKFLEKEDEKMAGKIETRPAVIESDRHLPAD